MAVTLNAKNKRKCDVICHGPIVELGHILGPVYGARLATPTIIKLVSNGRKVYEIDPKNPNNKVLLTVANCATSPFGDTAPVVTPVAPVVKPVVEPIKTIIEEKVEEPVSAHADLLKKLGLTEAEWSQKSKSERRRLKAQNEHVEQETKVNEPIVDQPTVEKVDTVEEAAEVKAEPVVEEKKVETEVPVEEEIVSADM